MWAIDLWTIVVVLLKLMAFCRAVTEITNVNEGCIIIQDFRGSPHALCSSGDSAVKPGSENIVKRNVNRKRITGNGFGSVTIDGNSAVIYSGWTIAKDSNTSPRYAIAVWKSYRKWSKDITEIEIVDHCLRDNTHKQGGFAGFGGTSSPISNGCIDTVQDLYQKKVIDPAWVVFENKGVWPGDPRKLVDDFHPNGFSPEIADSNSNNHSEDLDLDDLAGESKSTEQSQQT